MPEVIIEIAQGRTADQKRALVKEITNAVVNTCSVPALPSDHPPTLFLHGATDPLVPIATMTSYRQALVTGGHDAMSVVAPDRGHEWIPQAVTAVPAWFDAH